VNHPVFRLTTAQVRSTAIQYISEAPDGTWVNFKDEDRTLEQNELMWPWLRGFAQQLAWEINGEETYMSETEWKDVLTAAFIKEVRAAREWDGSGVVMLGIKTSGMGKRRFAEWMEFLIAEATLHGIEPVFKSGEKRWGVE